MIRWSGLGLALLLNARVLWDALGAQTVPVDTAVTHILITVPIVAVLLGGLRMATKVSAQRNGRTTRAE
jgi:hypothetical protein